MKTHNSLSTLLVVAFALAPQLPNVSHGILAASGGGTYSAKLIAPTIGQVLHPGQQVRIQWKDTLPNVQYGAWCEMEVWLSLDGGRSFPMWITLIIVCNSTYIDRMTPTA